MFESAYKIYCQKYGKYDFPSNLDKEKIIYVLQKWMNSVEEKYKKYYLAIINILCNKPIPMSIFDILKEIEEKKKREKEEKEEREREKEEREREKEEREREKEEREKEENEKKRYNYLYKALHENRSNRTTNLSCAYYAKKAKDTNDEFDNSIYNLYLRSNHIDVLENKKNSIKNNINNLNYELNSINNSITNTQDMINHKNNAIASKSNNFLIHVKY